LLPQALRVLRLQLLHALLQPIDAVLTLHALARKHVALPFLRGLLELLHTLLTLELPLFWLQQPLLRALRPRAFRLLRLQLLNALLQPIDALLALQALARRYVARALLRGLLPLLDALLALAGPLLLRWARARRGRCARARRCGDSRRGRARRCSDVRHRTRCHGRTLWRRSRTGRRCGGPRHCRRRCGAGHGGRWRRTSHGGRRCRGSGRGRRRSGPSVLLGIRAHARRDHRNAEKKCCKAKAGRTHDRRYLLTLWSPVTLNARPRQSIGACHCGFATQGDG
jgi:hypothetical protein